MSTSNSPTASALGTPDPRRWYALGLLCMAFFMVILDVTIVAVALPTIGTALDFAPADLQWVVTAYVLANAGALMLGGRAADYLGRRRVFMVGMAMFGVGSAACGLASDAGVLIGARAAQGLAAAFMVPAALSIITTTFHEGPERNRALGVWGGVAGGGAAFGVILGGVLTDVFGWPSIFLVNLFVVVPALVLAPILLNESRAGVRESFDLLGALTLTGGLGSIVYGVTRAPVVGWDSADTAIALVAGIALLVAFVWIESRVASPMVPLRFFRVQQVAGANLAGMLMGTAIYGEFFLASFYLQGVLGLSPIRTGSAFLAQALTFFVVAGVAQNLVTRVGPRPVMAIGGLGFVAGAALLTQVSADGSYWSDAFPGLVLCGAGAALAFIPISIAAFMGVDGADAGLASGLVNTAQQVGGAVGTAIVASIAASRTRDLVAIGRPLGEALTAGYARAFGVPALAAAAVVVVALVTVRGRPAVGSAPPAVTLPTPRGARERNGRRAGPHVVNHPLRKAELA